MHASMHVWRCLIHRGMFPRRHHDAIPAPHAPRIVQYSTAQYMCEKNTLDRNRGNLGWSPRAIGPIERVNASRQKGALWNFCIYPC
jgi:hypothetical protein